MFSASCAICISLLNKSDDILSTVCGHVFHMPCLTQWLERSKNCPSCRQKLSTSRIFRLYMTFNNDDSIREDPASLNERIMNMQFQIDLKNAEIQNSLKSNQEIGKQRDLLKTEVKKLETEISKKTSAIYGLKEQVKYFQDVARGREQVDAQYNALKKKIETFESVERLVSASSEEVEQMLRKNPDTKQLCTYVAVLQKQLTTDGEKRKQLRLLARAADEKCRKLEADKRELEQQLKDKSDLEIYVDSLEKEVRELKNKLFSKKEEKELVHASSSPDLSRKLEKPTTRAIVKDSTVFSSDDEENLITHKRFKISTAKNSLKPRALVSSSILQKRQRLAYQSSSQPQTTNDKLVPDGLGGYTKIETFPVPNRNKVSSSSSRVLKRKAENNPKISSFVDLT